MLVLLLTVVIVFLGVIATLIIRAHRASRHGLWISHEAHEAARQRQYRDSRIL